MYYQKHQYYSLKIITQKNKQGKYSVISGTLKKGKEIVDIQVENALLKRALGYVSKEQKVTKDGEIIELEKEIPPDTTAQIFWLKNRKPDKWRDKVENVNANDDDKVININICSTKGKTI